MKILQIGSDTRDFQETFMKMPVDTKYTFCDNFIDAWTSVCEGNAFDIVIIFAEGLDSQILHFVNIVQNLPYSAPVLLIMSSRFKTIL